MQSSSSPQTTLLLVVVVLAAVLVRQGRNNPASKSLGAGQRIRPLLLEWLDPVIPIVAIGSLLFHDLGIGLSHVACGILGGALGVCVGLYRSRVMFVRALPSAKSVVLTRSTAEYLMVGLLVILRIAEDSISRVQSTPFTLLLTALLALSVVESLTRSIGITVKYLHCATRQPSPLAPVGEE